MASSPITSWLIDGETMETVTDFFFFFFFWGGGSKSLQMVKLKKDTYFLEKEMATHSSILAWRIPWTEELGGLQFTGHKESDTSERLHFHFWRLNIPLEMFCKTEDPFSLLPPCISVSILSLDFSSSSLLSLWYIKAPGIQTPIRWLF